ncbi:hypothetical protein tb265_39590 [Gemmatimonadetes bacterium T265]|nr:hypothetical protein tb265_39590 [Gemmatimonadetes bacterium T265]
MPRSAAVVAPALAALVVIAGAGCAPSSQLRAPQLAPGNADAPGVAATVAALAGTWTGQYDAPVYARRGALQLALRPAARVDGGTRTSTVVGSATIAGAGASARVALDSARVGRGRVVLYFAPFADPESGATLRLRLDGALAGDTLGGRLRADAAATVVPERHGGWRLVRVTAPVTAPVTASRLP